VATTVAGEKFRPAAETRLGEPSLAGGEASSGSAA